MKLQELFEKLDDWSTEKLKPKQLALVKKYHDQIEALLKELDLEGSISFEDHEGASGNFTISLGDDYNNSVAVEERLEKLRTGLHSIYKQLGKPTIYKAFGWSHSLNIHVKTAAKDKETVEGQAGLIKHDCAAFLNSTGVALYRGVKIEGSKSLEDLGHGIFRGKVREDRKPADTSKEVHQALDNWFSLTFGIAARSGAIFCRTKNKAISQYGEPCLIFPIGEFKYVWSPYIADAWDTFEQGTKMPAVMKRVYDAALQKAKTENNMVTGDGNNYKWRAAATTATLEKMGTKLYKDTDLKPSENEIMVKCSSYYVVRLNQLARDGYSANQFLKLLRN